MRITADVNKLAEVRDFIRQQAEQVGVDAEAVPDIVQAVDECVTNSIVHGYQGSRGSVEVEVEVDRDRKSLIVRIEDQAPPFDPTSVPSPDTTADLDERRLGGMGLFLARDLMDVVSYRHTDEGNQLTLIKQCITNGRSESKGDR